MRVVFWPACKVIGVVMPLMLKPVPLATTCEMVTLAFPVFVRVTGCLPLPPTETLPNAMLVGLAVSVAVVATPAPESANA